MPAVRAQRARPKRFDYRKLPLWVQWTLPFATAVLLVVALVVFVQYETNHVPAEAAVSKKALSAEEAQAVVNIEQTQTPQRARLAAGVAPAAGLRAALTSWSRAQISTGLIDGPLNSITCSPTAGSTSARVAMRCALVAANVTYPMFGVVIPSRRSITFCQWVEWPPLYGTPNVPLSAGCLATGAAQPKRPPEPKSLTRPKRSSEAKGSG